VLRRVVCCSTCSAVVPVVLWHGCADQGGGTFMHQTRSTVSGTRAAWPSRSEAGAPALPVQLCPSWL